MNVTKGGKKWMNPEKALVPNKPRRGETGGKSPDRHK